jgi:hypothetical protein
MRTPALFAIILLFAGAATRAQEPDTQAAPVTINACEPKVYTTNGPSVAGVSLTGTSSGIQIQFTNTSPKTANLVNFAVDSNGTSFVIRDVGTFSPNVEITHGYRNGSGQSYVLPSFIAPNVKCSVQSVHFTDGSIWPEQPQTLGPSGLMSSSPTRVEMKSTETSYFMISTREQVAGFSERDNCKGIAAVTTVASGGSSSTYGVQGVSLGSCTATIQDEDGHILTVPITVH